MVRRNEADRPGPADRRIPLHDHSDFNRGGKLPGHNHESGAPSPASATPCSPGNQVPGSDPPIYYGQYAVSEVGVGSGSSAAYNIPSNATFVDGTLSVFSLPTGLMIAIDGQVPEEGSFSVTAPADDTVFAQYRAGCVLFHGT